MKKERELVVRARSGDKAACGELLDRNLPDALRVARHIIGSPETANELVQEAMVQAYLSLPKLQDETRFQNWLHGIVRNVCHNYLRSSKGEPISWDALDEYRQDPGLTTPGPQMLIEEQEWRKSIWIAVTKLAPPDRAAIRLFYYEQNNTAEIAAVLHISIEAVRVRLHRARKQLEAPLLQLYSGAQSRGKRRTTLITITGSYNHGGSPAPSKKGKYQDEKRMAEAALVKYGIVNARVTLTGRPRNAESNLPLWVDDAATGKKYLLRFYRQSDFGTAEAIASEMTWLQALHQDVAPFIPEPVPNLDGAFVTDAGIHADGTDKTGDDGWLCSLTHRVDGKLIGFHIGTRRAHSLGVMMARMHRHSETWTPPSGFVRPSYDGHRLSTDLAPLRAGIETGRITEYAVGVYEAFFAQLRGKLERMGQGADVWGMIHANIHDENRVCYRHEVRPIDFADCGFGYYMHDIAVARTSLYPDEQKAFYEGYASVRPLPPDYEDQVMDFLLVQNIRLNYYHGFISGERPDDPAEQAAGSDEVARRIEQISLKPWAEIDTSVYEEYAGRYVRVPDESLIHGVEQLDIVRDGDRLLYQRQAWPAFQIYPIEGGGFYERNWAWRFTFQRDESGRVVSVTHDWGKNVLRVYKKT